MTNFTDTKPPRSPTDEIGLSTRKIDTGQLFHAHYFCNKEIQ